MTADRLDLDALAGEAEALAFFADGERNGELVPLAYFTRDRMAAFFRNAAPALIARARDRDLHEALIDAARRHRDDALALVEGLRRTCSRLRADRDAALTGVATRDNLLRMQGEELARVVAERDAARAALARVTDERLIERMRHDLELAGRWDEGYADVEAGLDTILATIRAVTGEGQEAAHG